MARKSKRSAEYDALLKEYRKLAKRADQRLVRLEQAQSTGEVKNALHYAYKTAMKSIRKWSGENANRFNRKPPTRIDSLRSKIRDIERFLSKTSSRVGGIKKQYISGAKTMNQKYGTDFTAKDLIKFFESPEWEKYGNGENSAFGYPTYMMAIGVLQDNEKELVKALKKGEQINLDIDKDKVSDAVGKLLDQYGLDFKKLYQ